MRRFHIYRYDPERDAPPRLESYDFEARNGERMLLDALMRLKAIDLATFCARPHLLVSFCTDLHGFVPRTWRFACWGLATSPSTARGLATFSTFSAEVVARLTTGRLVRAPSTMAVHVAGASR